MARSIRQDFQLLVGLRLVVREDIVTKGKVLVRKLVSRKTLVVLDLKVTVDWLCELHQR